MLVFSTVLGQELVIKIFPYSIQVHHIHPDAFSEAGTFNVLSVSGRLLEAETLSKDPHRVFKLTGGQFSDMNIFISVHTANFVLHELKHPLGIFAQSLRVSGRLKAAYQSLKAYLRQQL